VDEDRNGKITFDEFTRHYNTFFGERDENGFVENDQESRHGEHEEVYAHVDVDEIPEDAPRDGEL
jgi:hypothetical protein